MNYKELSEELAKMSSLQKDAINPIDPHLAEHLSNFVPLNFKQNEPMYIGKIVFDSLPSMALSGWMYSRQLLKSKELNINPENYIAIYKENVFQPVSQFSFIHDMSAILVGCGDAGKILLEETINANLNFDNKNFDTDGYAK